MTDQKSLSRELKNRGFFCYQCGGGASRRNHRWKCYDTFRKNGLSGVRVHTSIHGHILQVKNRKGNWETILRIKDYKKPEGIREVTDKIDALIAEVS